VTGISFGRQVCQLLRQPDFSSARRQFPDCDREPPGFVRPFVIGQASQSVQVVNDRSLLTLRTLRRREKQNYRG
jgi:hypothetical protein